MQNSSRCCGFTQCDMLFSHPKKIPPPPLSSAALVCRRCLRHSPLPHPKRCPRTPPLSSPSRACLRRHLSLSTPPTTAHQLPPSLFPLPYATRRIPQSTYRCPSPCGQETVHKRQTRTNGQRDERRWWAADNVTRVADDDGRQTMMTGNKRS